MFVTQNVTVKLAVPQSTETAVVVSSIEHASMNYIVLCVVFGILGLYGLGFLWIKRVRSKEQVHMGATIIPHRSYYRKPHHYFLLFYTGSGRHAGTTANVYCVIYGTKKNTKPIVLRDPERLLFQSGTITSFLLTLNQSLDQITKIQLWHDISGPKPSWYLERVIITHLNTGITWCFEGNRWLDVSGGETVECTLDALPRSQYLKPKPLFDKTFSESFKNKHVWLSCFLLKNRTNYSRYEKLATCLAITMTTVLMATIVVAATLKNDPFPSSAIRIGPMEFRIGDVIWSAVSSVLPFALRLGLEILFTYSEKKTHLAPDENDIQGYMEYCLVKANEITILEGQSNNSSELDDEIEHEIQPPQDGIAQHDLLLENERIIGLNYSSSKQIGNFNESSIALDSNEIQLEQGITQSNLPQNEQIELNNSSSTPNSNSNENNDALGNGVQQIQYDLPENGDIELNCSSSKRNNANLHDKISLSTDKQQDNDRIRADSVLSSEWQYNTDHDNSLSEISLGEVGLHFDDDMTSFASSEGGFHANSDVIDMLERKADTIGPNDGSAVNKAFTNSPSNVGSVENKANTNRLYDGRAANKAYLSSPNKGRVVNNGIPNTGFVGNGISVEQLNELNKLNNEKVLSNGHCQQETNTNGKQSNETETNAKGSNGFISSGKSFEDGITEQNQGPGLPQSSAQTEQLNFAYTNSLRNIDKVSKLWQMLPGLPGFLIDPNSVKINMHDTKLTLHHKYFYLAVAVCVIMTMVSIVVSIRYGVFWTLQTSTTWLMIILLTLFFQIFVFEILFMVFQSFYFAIILQRPTEENDVINEQKNKVWSKEEDDIRYYVDDLDDTSSPVPSPPSEEEVKKAREKAGQDRQLEEVLAMVAFDVLFLIQLVIIGFGNRDVEGYPMRVLMENNYNIAKFNEINSPKQFWNWSKDHLVTGLYYQGRFKEENSRQTRDGYGTLLGVPILRQQRIKPNGTCTLNKYGKIAKFPQCNVALPDKEDYDRRQLYPRWATRPSIDVISLSPWRYKTGSQSNTDYTAHTRIGSYEPGGYIASLGYNKTSALAMLNELEMLGWVDRFTRVVFIEYAVYNGNNNMMSTVLIAVEFTAFGGAFPSFEHNSFRLYRYFTTLQLAYLVCEIIFVVFIVQLMYRVLCEIHEQRLEYFKHFWNWTDFVLVISSLVTIGLYGARAMQLQQGVSAITENPEVFFSFYSIGFYDNLVAYLSCIVVIIPMIQFFKFLKFNRSFMIFDKTLRVIAPDIGGFALIFLISLIAFAFWAFHMLRLELEAYSSFPSSFNSILSMLLGKFSFRVFSPGSTQEYGPLFTYVFTVCNVFFIMTIILCIITLGFTTAKEEEVESKYQIVKFIVDRLKDTLGLNPPYIPPKPVIREPEVVDYADLQLQMNTRYILSSQLARMGNFANTVYSEETIDDFRYIETMLSMRGCVEYLEATIRGRAEARRRHGDRLAITNVPDEDSCDKESQFDDTTSEENRENLTKGGEKNKHQPKSGDFVV